MKSKNIVAIVAVIAFVFGTYAFIGTDWSGFGEFVNGLTGGIFPTFVEAVDPETSVIAGLFSN